MFMLHRLDYQTTKQITNTAEQERDIDFAPDGRSIVYSSERNGIWQIYETKLRTRQRKTLLMQQIWLKNV